MIKERGKKMMRRRPTEELQGENCCIVIIVRGPTRPIMAATSLCNSGTAVGTSSTLPSTRCGRYACKA